MAANSNVSLSISIDRHKVLGKGAYGIVYEGTWMSRKVAVKRIQMEDVQNNKGGEEALQKLDHQNVVKLHHVESDIDFRFYALEFCQASLDHKFLDERNPRKYRGPMPPDEEVCLQLAKGLAHIHENRLIHRDLKPQTVLIWVDPTGEKVLMKWSGFGLSKQVDERGSHSISGMRGTQNWHSPEILKIFYEEGNVGKTTTTTPYIRQRGTVKSDVYTAGLVFGYYLLDGDHPFGSPINVLPNIFKNEPVNLKNMKEHHMHAIIMEMLKDNPNERISSADVVSRLNNLIEFDVKCVSLSLKYNRKAILGRGGYGIVYKGEWNNKRVAVKRIPIEDVENNKGGEEPLQELDHPNVVKLHHVESNFDFKYYALELCQASLHQLFKGNETQKKYRQKMPPEKEVCLQLAKGLAHIHENRLIHRDLKPHNVLIWADSRQEKVVMKWADFGLSKQVSERGTFTMSAGVKGTENWFSPEILKLIRKGNDGKTATTTPNIRPRGTVKSDVFSAGLVFGYYLLDGDHPFGSEKNIEENIDNNEPVNLPKIKDPSMHAIIMDMLKANPNERISSADVVTRINNLIELHYIQRYFGIVSTEDDTKWNELVAPAPMGIAVMSQLLICSYRVRDFKIDKIDKDAFFFLLKHPESFCTTLVQIVIDAYSAFMKAHTNMEKIQSQMAQLAVYVADCAKIFKSDNKVDIRKLVPRRLECIKEAADDGKKLSKEVCDAFELLGQLIRQVLEAMLASHKAKGKAIEAAIQTNIWEKKRRQEAAINGQKISEKEMQKILDEYTTSLKNMHIDVEKEISTDPMIQILKDGMKLLSDLQGNWTGMTCYFNSFNNYIEQVMKKYQQDFVEDAKDAQENTFIIDIMADSIKKSLESSIKSHRTAATYVKVSNNYILGPLRSMHGMLTIKPAEMQKAQKELVESCERASQGIQIMFNEAREQAISEILNFAL